MNEPNNQIKPKLPEKLPPESRKKLSILFQNNESNESSFEFRQSRASLDVSSNLSKNIYNENDYYKDPIEQPTFYSETNRDSTNLSFFNDSIYLQSDQIEQTNQNDNLPHIEQNDYLCLNKLESVEKNESIPTKVDSFYLNDINEKLENLQVENSNTSISSSNSANSALTENSSLNEMTCTQTIEQAPPIPPKRTKRILSLSSLSLDTNHKNLKSITEFKKRESLDENYLQPSDKKAYTIEFFRKEIFKNEENKTCADCKRIDHYTNWISCLYFITLCDSCAEIHKKLPHLVNKYYLIEINKLYDELTRSQSNSNLNIDSFLYILKQTGNEKLNSLLEYNIDKIRYFSPNLKTNRETFIKDKYLNKKFINSNEIDLTSNYLDELNKTLYNIVSGPSLSMTIYYLFLGANQNFIQSNKTLLDKSLDSNQLYQSFYLIAINSVRFNQLNESYFNELEFSGEATQLFNYGQDKSSLKKTKINLKLTNSNTICLQSMSINFKSIIKIFNITDKLIQIKWCDQENHSILSAHLEFVNFNEKQLWYKRIFFKYVLNYTKTMSDKQQLFDLIESCQINSMGNLSLMNQVYLDNNKQETENGENVLVVLIETLDSQVNNFFNKSIILIRSDEKAEAQFEVLDIRKLVRIKTDQELLIIDMNSKSYKLKSIGYGENLKLWHEKLFNFSQLEHKSIEEQYLSKENYPISIDKCCSFIEIYFLTEKLIYSLPAKNSIFDFKSETSNKKHFTLLSKLEKDKDYLIDLKETQPSAILNVFKCFILKYFKSYHFDLFKNESQTYKINCDNLKKSLETIEKTYPIFYSTLKRFCMHFNFISRFKYLNNMSTNYLAVLFDKLIHNSKIDFKGDLVTALEILIDNCEFMFNFKSGYLKTQCDVFEKVIQLKSNNQLVSSLSNISINQNYLITIFLFHKHSEQSFQIQIDTKFTCKDALIRAQAEFNFYESKYWCLFEVFDYEQHLSFNGIESNQSDKNWVLLERVLPTNARLIDSISNWNSFSLVIKYNFIQIDLERFYLLNDTSLNALSFYETCQLLILCENCGYFRTTLQNLNSNIQCNSPLHKKWKNGHLTVRNANVKLTENNNSKKKSESSELNDLDNTKLIYEEKIEECQFFYGLYEHNLLNLSNLQVIHNDSIEDLTRISFSSTNKLISASTSEMIINEEECLTFYDRKQKLLYLVHLESTQTALTRYANLFKLAFYPDTWSHFKSDQLPNLKPKIPEISGRKSINLDNLNKNN